ncbi:MAG: hypothetical protein KatS3mg028_0946 [Bacteroidia bacterium]|nr:MAG: hypothetical protein KatS3mg028_0946 [Bacteroidia bacterium]
MNLELKKRKPLSQEPSTEPSLFNDEIKPSEPSDENGQQPGIFSSYNTPDAPQEPEKNFNPLELAETNENPPVAKIIEKEHEDTNTSTSTSAIEQLSENIKTLSEKTDRI